MNILDHRILIPRPKSPEMVWAIIGDLSNNPTWQTDCRSVSFISTDHIGANVRWRYTTTSGRDYVAQTTAWYDGLGYEYKIVDGLAVKENQGRIRLQEIPDGTVVQWTFSYDVGGLLGGVRNALSVRRQFESVMVDSLKMLWRVVNKANEGDKSHEARSLMRDAPGYEARMQYKPRHPSAKPLEAELPQTAVPVVINEPPVSEDDTRPRQPVVLPEPAELADEPEFLSELPAVPVVTIIEPAPEPETVILPPPVPVQIVDSQQEAIGDEPEASAPFPAVMDQPVIVEITPSETAPVEPEIADGPVEIAASKAQTAEIPAAVPAVSDATTVIAPRIEKRDTAEVSVFELFGLPKPSETQEMRPVVQPDVTTMQLNRVLPDTIAQVPRIGSRIGLRRKMVKIRRPGV